MGPRLREGDKKEKVIAAQAAIHEVLQGNDLDGSPMTRNIFIHEIEIQVTPFRIGILNVI